MLNYEEIEKNDYEVFQTIDEELKRQQNKIELIASENFVSKAVLSAVGSVLTNKYAEGYPDKRYYGGCEAVDKTEKIAIERAKKLFGAEHANVQPHSGSQANQAVYMSVLSPGDTILGMSLAHGGHLTHGSPVNFSGKLYNIVPYEVSKDTETIDYEEVRRLALEHKPKLIVAGASAYSREIDFKKFYEIKQEVGCMLMVDMAHIAGLVATGHHQNPVPYADFVTSTTHKTLRGPRGGLILCKEEYAKIIDKTIFPGIQGGPLMHVIAGKAVSFGECLQPEYKTYIDNVCKNAKALSTALIKRGFRVVSGGTDNHIVCVDVTPLNLTGKVSEKLLDDVGITCNKNAIPFDKESPFITSGIRLGTPAVTTRGMNEDDMDVIAEIIFMTLNDFDNNKEKASKMVAELLTKYPLY